MITDIIWDFDGTLYDTYPGTVSAFIKAFKDYGIEETKENVLDYVKVSMTYAITNFKAIYNLDDGFIDSYLSYKRDIKPEMIKPFPFAPEICSEFAASGGRNYIVTHRDNSTNLLLQNYDMTPYFTEVITREYGFKRKPDPEALHYLIQKYHINKDTALIIGDRDCEILAGKAAGIKTCFYNTNDVVISDTPDYNISSLQELTHIITMER